MRRFRGPWFAAWCAGMIALVVLLLTLVPHLRNSAELVRLRNALLLQAPPAAYDWIPERRPKDFDVDLGEPLPSYRDTVVRGQLRVEGDDWATALNIAAHLLSGGKRRSAPIQSDLEQTYRRIVQQGDGYCGDYADVFTGLAYAAGLTTRSWAFSFDGFGGSGHIFNEVWDRGMQRWIAIDVFNNVYFGDETGRALSAVELRARLIADRSPRMVRIRGDVRPGFIHDARAIAFYRQGLDQWYMWWSTAVFAYDRSPLVRAFGLLGRSAEQLAGIAMGVHPGIRILQTPSNVASREAMINLRWRLLGVVMLLPACLAITVLWLRATRRTRPHGA